MAVAINLVPQDKQDQLQDARKKKLAFSLILLINGGLIGLIVVLFLIVQGQNFAINRTQSDINSKQEEFEDTENVEEIITLQKNLESLPDLYQTKAVYTKFLDVFEKVAPTQILISTLSSVEDGKLEVTGTAPDYRLVTKLAEAMQKKDGGKFENVQIRSANGEDGRVSFTLSARAKSGVTSQESK